MHRDGHLGRNGFDQSVSLDRVYRENAADRNEKNVDLADTFELFLRREVTEVATMAEHHASDIELEDDVLSSLPALLGIVKGLYSGDAHLLLRSITRLLDDKKIALDDPCAVMIEMIVAHENDVRLDDRLLDADGLAVMGVHDNYDLVLDRKTGMSVPGNDHGRPSQLGRIELSPACRAHLFVVAHLLVAVRANHDDLMMLDHFVGIIRRVPVDRDLGEAYDDHDP